jgi:RNA polymerase sigma-70 factor (ECF subfamily)
VGFIEMQNTSLSLLDRLRSAPGAESWDRLVELYTPLLRRWLARFDVQEADADDLVQEVLLAVSRDVSTFEHNGHSGAFRSWLRTILVHRLRYFWRTNQRRQLITGGSDIQQRIGELEDPQSHVSRMWDLEHDRHVAGKLLESVKRQFQGNTWQAFSRLVLDEVPPREVAAELDLSLNAVFIAKSRVLRRLREESAGLVDSNFEILSNR